MFDFKWMELTTSIYKLQDIKQEFDLVMASSISFNASNQLHFEPHHDTIR